MYKISQEQIKSITDLMYSLNIPVQAFSSLNKMLSELEPVEKVEEKTK